MTRRAPSVTEPHARAPTKRALGCAKRMAWLNAQHKQRGTAAIEFAFVFPLFFVVLYAIVAYCLILCANMTLAGAAQEAARAALGNAAGMTSTQTQYTQRMANACTRASGLTSWLMGAAGGSCGASAPACLSGASTCIAVSQAACGPSNAMVCITVAMNYNYAGKPIVPSLPLLGFVTPAKLTASSTVQLDPASVMSNM